MKAVIEDVYSPCYGKVEKIFITESSYVYEWEKLALIETIDKQKVEIKVGISGYIELLEVEEGQVITDKTRLITVRDDLLITGSD
ncbi:biotin/lipoyl-containing protein [Bacillus arachidis]|uniref:biotin/lipoyl-containing protein n=1 Tax=Bacillus arachidis TaxID=2819290 RepID=UPI00255C62C7|nr:biotin/lipoyl-containing protein [Bacillus arachidis]WIY61763.1 biotin/lipoyl-containing protein [Bacillus arachidis]